MQSLAIQDGDVKKENRVIESSKKAYTTLDLHALEEKVVCLTLDLEQDYGDLLEEPSYEGLEHILELVSFFKEKDIPLTCFVQGSLFESHPDKIDQLAQLDVEFELHSYSHPGHREMNTKFEVERGKEAYIKFFGKDPIGYRAPLGVIDNKDYQILASNGFKFDSSVFPSLRPGTFNNLRKPTKPFRVNSLEIVEFPLTVFSSIIRIPIALSYIKLVGRPYFYLLKTFPLPNLIVFGFHLHDLFQLSSSNAIPIDKSPFIYRRVFKRVYQGSKDGLIILDELSMVLQKKGFMFLKLTDIYSPLAKGAHIRKE